MACARSPFQPRYFPLLDGAKRLGKSSDSAESRCGRKARVFVSLAPVPRGNKSTWRD